MAVERQDDQAQQQQRIRTVRQLDSLVEQRIREAAEKGTFDNLSTKGKPVQLDLKDAIDHEAWFVNRTMKSLGGVPAWMELGKEIDADDERLRWMAADFARWIAASRDELLPLPPEQRNQRRPGIELRFEDRFTRYARLAERLRAGIDRFNIEVPVRVLEKPGVWVAHELRRLREPYEALCHELGWNLEPALGTASPTPHAPEQAEPERPTESSDGHKLLGLWRRASAERAGKRPRSRP